MPEKNLVIVDLDGTLADGKHRERHLHPKDKRDWDAYYAECHLDTPHEDVIKMVNALSMSGLTIVILTGRREDTRKTTEEWLEHKCVHYDALIMRPIGNFINDHIWKPEIIKLFGKENILMVIEDRNRIVKALREEGYRVVQVADGDF